MKRLSLISLAISILFLFTGLVTPAPAPADPLISVLPPSHDFGEVELGTSSTVEIEIRNYNGHTLIVYDIDFQEGSNSDFFLDVLLTFPVTIYPLSSMLIPVVFMPSTDEFLSANLDITSNDVDNTPLTIPLQGRGIAQQSVTIEDILAFFDAGVEAGTIQGTGPSNNARENHLKVFKLKLLMVNVFLDTGTTREACTLLWHAYDRSDDQDSPKDFIEGDEGSNDVFELNAMILALITGLGCE